MPDPIIATDPTALTIASSAGAYALLKSIHDLRKYFMNKNGNNPHTKRIAKLFDYHDEDIKAINEMKTDIAVIKNNVERIDKKLA